MKEMTFEQSDIAKKLADYKLPRYNELSSFPVVMRQLIKILDNYFSVFLLPGEEKFLTQSMINSYVYKKVIDAPINKEYDRKHIVHLISIGIFKQVLPISDVGKLISMQMNQYPIDIAYNYLCDEIENALKITFGSREFGNLTQVAKVRTPLTERICSAVFAFVNKIYVKQSIYFVENYDK